MSGCLISSLHQGLVKASENLVALKLPLYCRGTNGHCHGVCCVMSLMPTHLGKAAGGSPLFGVEGCRGEPWILLCHRVLLCPCLSYLFSKKIEATGGKRVFAPAPRKTACVSESVPAHSAGAGLDSCVCAVFGCQTRALHWGGGAVLPSLLLTLGQGSIVTPQPWGLLLTRGSAGLCVRGTWGIQCERQDGSWEEMDNRREGFAGVTRVSHAAYCTCSNAAPAHHGHEHTPPLTAQLASAYNNFC